MFQSWNTGKRVPLLQRSPEPATLEQATNPHRPSYPRHILLRSQAPPLQPYPLHHWLANPALPPTLSPAERQRHKVWQLGHPQLAVLPDVHKLRVQVVADRCSCQLLSQVLDAHGHHVCRLPAAAAADDDDDGQSVRQGHQRPPQDERRSAERRDVKNRWEMSCARESERCGAVHLAPHPALPPCSLALT